MLIAFAIFIAILVGAWAGIAFDGWTLDAKYGDTESVGTYLADPWRTLRRVWDILGE